MFTTLPKSLPKPARAALGLAAAAVSLDAKPAVLPAWRELRVEGSQVPPAAYTSPGVRGDVVTQMVTPSARQQGFGGASPKSVAAQVAAAPGAHGNRGADVHRDVQSLPTTTNGLPDKYTLLRMAVSLGGLLTASIASRGLWNIHSIRRGVKDAVNATDKLSWFSKMVLLRKLEKSATKGFFAQLGTGMDVLWAARKITHEDRGTPVAKEARRLAIRLFCCGSGVALGAMCLASLPLPQWLQGVSAVVLVVGQVVFHNRFVTGEDRQSVKQLVRAATDNTRS